MRTRPHPARVPAPSAAPADPTPGARRPWALLGTLVALTALGAPGDPGVPGLLGRAEAQGPAAVPGGPAPAPWRTVLLEPPCPRPGARFGSALGAPDLDGDGRPDLLVGAPGEGRVHLFVRTPRGPAPFAPAGVLGLDGERACADAPAGDGFGTALAWGQLQPDPREEWVVGAPRHDRPGAPEAGAVAIFGLGADALVPRVLTAAQPVAGARMGFSVAIGDLDDDGLPDVVAGAEATPVGGLDLVGRVHVFLDATGPAPIEVVLDDPTPVEEAAFGHQVLVHDWTGDGSDDLIVSAVWNDHSVLGPKLGQVLVYPGPLGSAAPLVLEDDLSIPGDEQRFGMHLSVARRELLVGTPRRDWTAVDDGMAWSFRAPLGAPPTPLDLPGAADVTLLGFRVAHADLTGGPALERVVCALGSTAHRGTWLFPRPGSGVAPTFLPARADDSDHFCQGLTTADWFGTAHADLALGDPHWEAPGASNGFNSGRVAVRHRGWR